MLQFCHHLRHILLFSLFSLHKVGMGTYLPHLVIACVKFVNVCLIQHCVSSTYYYSVKRGFSDRGMGFVC